MKSLKCELDNAVEKVIINNGQINNSFTRFEITKTIERILFQKFNSDHVLINGKCEQIKVVCNETNSTPESRNINITIYPKELLNLIDN